MKITQTNNKLKTKVRPDLTRVCRQKKELIVKWKIGEDLFLDNLPMEVDIKWRMDKKLIHRNNHLLIKKCDKQNYKTILENELCEWFQRTTQSGDINEIYDHLKNTITKEAEQTCPRNTTRLV